MSIEFIKFAFDHKYVKAKCGKINTCNIKIFLYIFVTNFRFYLFPYGLFRTYCAGDERRYLFYEECLKSVGKKANKNRTICPHVKDIVFIKTSLI